MLVGVHQNHSVDSSAAKTSTKENLMPPLVAALEISSGACLPNSGGNVSLVLAGAGCL